MFQNAAHGLDPGETPLNSSSYQASNHVQHFQTSQHIIGKLQTFFKPIVSAQNGNRETLPLTYTVLYSGDNVFVYAIFERYTNNNRYVIPYSYDSEIQYDMGWG